MDRPIIIPKKLACVVGLNEAIVLQQMHLWLKSDKSHKHNGKNWICSTYEDLQKKFPFWSLSTIKRIIRKLEKNQILISNNFNQSKTDRTKWYTIDYDKFDSLLNTKGEIK